MFKLVKGLIKDCFNVPKDEFRLENFHKYQINQWKQIFMPIIYNTMHTTMIWHKTKM